MHDRWQYVCLACAAYRAALFGFRVQLKEQKTGFGEAALELALHGALCALPAELAPAWALAALAAAATAWCRDVRGPLPPRGTLAGATYLVTGGNSGIGWWTARLLLLRGARVIIACRSPDRAAAAAEALARGAPAGAAVEREALDLSDLGSVRACAARLEARGVALDGLVLNAGVMLDARKVAADGSTELTVATNHVGHHLLAALLLPAVERARRGRVVFVASTIHETTTCAALRADPSSARGYTLFSAYAKSKLANLLAARALQRALAARGSAALAVAVHPGNVRTAITQNMSVWLQWANALALPLMVLFMKRTWEGAVCSVAALDDTLRGCGGAYLIAGDRVPPSKHAADEDCEAWLERWTVAVGREREGRPR